MANAIDMTVEDVKEWISEKFDMETGEKFEEQHIDGAGLVALSSSGSFEQQQVCGLSTVSQQLKLKSLLAAKLASTSEDSSDGTSSSSSGSFRRPKPKKEVVKQLGELDQRIYKAKRSAVRTVAISKWPGNKLPNFRTDKVAAADLEKLVDSLVETCSFPKLSFHHEGIKKNILDVLTERRRNIKKGHDYSQADKRTCRKRKERDSGGQVNVDEQTTARKEGDMLKESSSSEGKQNTLADPTDEGIARKEYSDGNEQEDVDEEDMDLDNNDEDVDQGLTEKSAGVVVMVAFNAVKLSDVTSGQLKSAAKALGISTKSKKRSDLLIQVGRELVTQGYAQVDNSMATVPFCSRQNVTMLKPF